MSRLAAILLVTAIPGAAQRTTSGPPGAPVRLPHGKGPVDAVERDGRLYVADFLGQELLIVHGKKVRKVPMVRPTTLHLGARRLYVADSGANRILVLDSTNGALAATIETGRWPTSIVPLDRGRSLLVAEQEGDTVARFDAAGGKLLWRADVGHLPFRIVVPPGEREAYVTCHGSSQVMRIDLAAGKVTGTFPAGRYPAGLALDWERKVLYVANFGGDTVDEFSIPSGERRRSLVVGHQPYDVLVLPGGAGILISHQGEDHLLRIRAAVKSRILVGSSSLRMRFAPHGRSILIAGWRGKGVVRISMRKILAADDTHK